MNSADELRREVIQEFAPRKDTPTKSDISHTDESVSIPLEQPISTKKAPSLTEALNDVMEKREEQDRLTNEEKDQLRKPVVECANIKLTKEMMRYLR